MFDRLKNILKFNIEQFLLRGAYARLLLVASLVGLAAIGGGLIIQATDAAFDGNESAIWWAFLRLTDPGYLGDDEGMSRRLISTILTILGYVLFMGSLIAIMTQWLNQKIRNFERGLTPIIRRNHILILGWTNRTPAIVEELMRSEGRVRRFLKLRGARGLHVVILSDDVSLERTVELRNALGGMWDSRTITFRSGTPLRLEHLERVDFLNASAIILPGADFVYGSANESDTHIVKTVLSIAHQQEKNGNHSLPLLVTELFDSKKILMLQNAYRGILEIMSSDEFITRCMAQNVRHPGMSHLFNEVLSHGHGSSIYVRTFESLAGYRFGDVAVAWPNAALLGVVRPQETEFQSMLNPSGDLTLESGDRLVFLAKTYEDCEIREFFPSNSQASRPPSQLILESLMDNLRRILILGWNHKVSALIKELDNYLRELFEISTLSLKPIAEREAELKQKGIDQHRVRVSHYEGDFTLLSDLEDINPSSYDNVLIFSSDWVKTQEMSDARTIMGHLVLKNILEKSTDNPKILVDLMDNDNVRLFQDDNTEILVAPMIASHVLAQVALRRELNVVYAELFGAGGAEIFFRSFADYGMMGQQMSYGTLKGVAAGYGEVALGVRSQSGGFELNPRQDKVYKLEEPDNLIVLR